MSGDGLGPQGEEEVTPQHWCLQARASASPDKGACTNRGWSFSWHDDSFLFTKDSGQAGRSQRGCSVCWEFTLQRASVVEDKGHCRFLRASRGLVAESRWLVWFFWGRDPAQGSQPAAPFCI